ncbi:YihY/virulence factor BrkB family protein [Paracoccus shanxieyensis]|uniref:YihY/virulence factor BrkB family protein n=1 Tax=Paracoccus shanxieyensis TaxID=2675752 RepID=UPI001E4177D3|nr:YihY/virulence factor BrkB family protein [Paracoccus shanxieyensis]
MGHQAGSPAQIPAKGWVQILWRVQSEITRDHIGVVAAGIAFYGLIAIFPAIAAIVGISGLILDPADLDATTDTIVAVLPPDAAAIIRDQMVKVTSSETGTGLVAASGLLLAIYGAMKGVMTLIEGLNIAYDEEETRGYLRLYLTGFAITLALVVGFILAIGLIVVLPALVELLHLGPRFAAMVCWINWPILAVFMMMGLAMLYRFGPARSAARWRWLSLGAALATVLWIAASLGFSAYASNFGSYTETYGTLAGVILLLTWLWLSAYVILAGAELNAETEQQTLRDTTTGAPEPMGQRGAVKADTPPPDLPDAAPEASGPHASDTVASGLYASGPKASAPPRQRDDTTPVTELGLAAVLAGRAVWRMLRAPRR